MTAILASALMATTLVHAPDVAFFRVGPDVWFVTTLRVHQALPQGMTGVLASIDVTGTTQDIPGLSRLAGTRDCYQQQTGATGPRTVPRDGRLVTVRVTIRGRRPQVLTEQVRAHETSALKAASSRRDRAVARRLGCAPPAPAGACHDVVTAERGLTIGVDAAGGGATCPTARRVLRAAGRWADSNRCFEDLCAHGHRRTAGFRCTVTLVGEASWTITCKRGRQVVRGDTAE